MSALAKIRNNPLLVLIVVGLGTGLFILMDMTAGQNLGGGAVGPAMGAVGDREISRQDFERTKAAVFNGGDDLQNRENLWGFYVTEAMILNEAEAQGMVVTEDEVESLTFGPRYSSVIRRNWAGPTGQFDPAILEQYRPIVEGGSRTIRDAIEARQIGPAFEDFWNYQNRQIVAQRQQDKMTAMVSKGMYAPSWLAQEQADDRIRSRQVAYVRVPFDEIDNSDISISDEDIDNYIAENPAIYTREQEERVLSYLVYEVIPSPEDSSEVRDDLIAIRSDFASTDNDSSFVANRQGTLDANFVPRSQVAPIVANELFDSMAVGEIYGPYVEGSAYKMAKLVDKETIPETADSRHVLISLNPQGGQTRTIEEAQVKADSIAGVLRAGGDWDVIAAEFSDDPGSKDNGGLYEGTSPGQFVPEYDDLIFRTGEFGRIYTVETQFGVHVIELLAQGDPIDRIKAAYIIQSIIPGENTDKAVRRQARAMLSEHGDNLDMLTAAAEEAGIRLQRSEALDINDYNIANLAATEETRNMVCEAFSLSEGDVIDRLFVFDHPVEVYPEKYVVAALTDVLPAGLRTAGEAREDLFPIVANVKKGEMIAQQIGQPSSLSQIASQYSVTIDTLASVNLGLTSLPGVGNEPKVVAAAMAAPNQQLTQAVVGTTGVFVLQPLTDPAEGQSGNLPSTRQQLNARARQGMNSLFVLGLRENTNVVDDRAAANCQ
ncbi:MAG: peptidylprolyl isomerase [Bacteroidota bacterium]